MHLAQLIELPDLLISLFDGIRFRFSVTATAHIHQCPVGNLEQVRTMVAELAWFLRVHTGTPSAAARA
jgi:hypothetical protein